MENKKEDEVDNLQKDPPSSPKKKKEERGNQKYESKKIIIGELEDLLKKIKMEKKIDNLNLFSIWHPCFFLTISLIFFLCYTLKATEFLTGIFILCILILMIIFQLKRK